MEGRKRQLSALHPSVPDVVVFAVGRERFAVAKGLLEKDSQSLLFALANRHYTRRTSNAPPEETDEPDPSPPRHRRKREDASADESLPPCGAGEPCPSAICIPDKDPALFRRILNVVRGYKGAIPNDRWREACLCDVAFYGLEKSWNAVFPPPEPHKFVVRTSPSFVTSAITCGLASPYYTEGQHVITFAVTMQAPEKVATGVETRDSGEVADSVAHAAHGEAYNRALYWNDGSVTHFFRAAQSFATGFPYKTSTLMRVFLDADERTVRWAIRGCDCVSMVRLPKREGGYAFCAVSQKGGRVDIVDVY